MIHILIPEQHPAYPPIKQWADGRGFKVLTKEPLFGNVLFVLSWPYKLWAKDYKHVYVIHESALPKGRGWSPLAHQILEGINEIPFTAFRLAEQIDTGPIALQRTLILDGSELCDEIHQKSAELKCRMMEELLDIEPEEVKQTGEPTYYPRRTPKDSRIDPDKSIRDQFNLLRICDDRFPAFFDLNGHRYEIRLQRC